MEYLEWTGVFGILRKVMLCALDDMDPDDPDIGEKIFFENLYVRRASEDEDAVLSAMQSERDVALVVAPRGGGKTTLFHWAIRRSSEELEVIWYDLKRHQLAIRRAIKKEPAETEIEIDRLLREYICNEVVKSTDDRVSLALLLLQNNFRPILDGVLLEYRVNNYLLTEEAAIERLRTDYERLSQIIKIVLEEAKTADLIKNIQRVYRKKKTVVVFDNVDRLDVELQPVLLSLAIDLHNEGQKSFAVVAALRDKNIVRYHDNGLGGDFVRVVSLNSNELITQPIKLGDPAPEHAENIIVSRQRLAKTLCEKLGSVQAREFWKLFDKISVCLNRRLVEEELHNLANHSFRRMLVYSLGFAQHLYRLIAREVIPVEEGKIRLDLRDCLSYLYRWLYAGSANFHRELLRDTITAYNRYIQNPNGSALDCDLDMVILTWLTVRKDEFVTVGNLFDHLSNIGIPYKKAVGTLFSLYNTSDPAKRYVELGSAETRLKRKDVDYETRLEATPLGREFCSKVITKFEYLHQALSYPRSLNESSDAFMTRLSKGVDDSVEILIKHLEKVRTVHLAALKEIKPALLRAGISQWRSYYRANFCIKRRLLLERIVDQHLTYLRALRVDNYAKFEKTYTAFLSEYSKEIDKL